jgi:hypothetical protein
MRRDVQEIFKLTPHDKQVMMFSATLSKDIRPVCKKFMQDVIFYLCGDFWAVYGSVVFLFVLLFTLLLFSYHIIAIFVECHQIFALKHFYLFFVVIFVMHFDFLIL